MAKIPQLSSSAPSVVAPLRGQLSLPVNFPTPVTSKAVSNAFAALANTASNVAELKQKIFDREQSVYSDSFYTAADDAIKGVLDNKEKEIDDRLKDANNPFTIADGDSFVYDAVEGWFNNKDNYSGLEGFRSLIPANQDGVLNRLRRTARKNARDVDTSLRSRGESIAVERNNTKNARELAGTVLNFENDQQGNPVVSSDYKTQVRKTFLSLITSGASQEAFDRISTQIVNRFLTPGIEESFYENPKSFPAYSKAIIDLLSDSEGNPYSPKAVDSIRDFQRTVNKSNKEAYEKNMRSLGGDRSTHYAKLSKKGDEDYADITGLPRHSTRANDLVVLGDAYRNSAYGSYLSETFENNYNENRINKGAYDLITPVILDGLLPSNHPVFNGKDVIEISKINKDFSEANLDYKLAVALDYYEKVQENLPSGVGNEQSEYNKRVVARALSYLEDYKLNFNGNAQAQDLFNKSRVLGNGSVPAGEMMNIIKYSQKVGSFDPTKMPPLTVEELQNFATANNKLRTDRDYRDQFTPEQIEDFQLLFAANAGNNEEAQMQSFFGTSIEGLSEIAADVPSYVSDRRYFGRQILGPKAGSSFTSLTDKLLTYAHIVLEQDPSYKAELENYEEIPGDAGNRSKKEKARKALENNLFEKVASLTGRNYIQHGYQQLFVDKEDFPISENKRNSDLIEVGRVLALNTAIGAELSKVIDNISKGSAIKPTTDLVPNTRRFDVSGAANIIFFKKEEVIKMLEEADSENTHPAVYQGLLDTVKNAPNDDSIPRALKQWIEGVRDGTSIKVTQDGKLHYEFKPHESGRAITTRSHSSSTIPVFIGEAGMVDVATRGMGFVDRVLTGEALFDEEDVFDLPVDTLIETNVPYEERAKKLLDTTAWNSAATIGETSSNGLVRVAKYSQNFKAYRIEQPITDIIDDEKRSSNVVRTPGFSSTYYGRQGAHVFRRSMAPVINFFANALDVEENIESSSIFWNQVIQEVPELKTMREIFEWVDNNNTKGLVGRWDIVTYSPSLPAIEKPEFFGVQEVKNVPSISHLEWRFRAVDPETDAVAKEWTITITDEKVLSMMQRNELYID